MFTDKVLAVFLTSLVVPRPLKAHPTDPLVQASLPLMELRSGVRKGDTRPPKFIAIVATLVPVAMAAILRQRC